jgi:hypothetical protein
MQFSLASGLFIPCRSKCSTQRPVLNLLQDKHTDSMVLGLTGNLLTAGQEITSFKALS